MWENIQVKRLLSNYLPAAAERHLLIITGARQTGKTTFVRKHYNNLPYYNLDAIEYRDQLGEVSTFKWANEIGVAVIDEIQKAPGLIDKIKYSFDEGTLDFSVLTGSSKILLLKKVRETLAGRITLREMFPFMLSELINPDGEKKHSILLIQLLADRNPEEILENTNSVLIGREWESAKDSQDWLLKWGGMANLVHITDPENRRLWLKDYATAYLERDLTDLADLNDLKPFRKFQQIAARRASNLISYTELARDSGVGIETARRYLEYLNISYQAFIIQPFYKNLTSSLVKTPKLFWFDNGLLRHLSGYGFEVDNGQLFENYIASELTKLIRTTRLDASLFFYRTRSGMEIDFILQTNKGIWGFEVKNRETVTESDFTNLKRVGEAAGKEWLGGLVIYRGNKIQKLQQGFWAVPSYRLFSQF